MIATLSGTVTHRLNDRIIVTVGGVGYLVHPTQKLLAVAHVGAKIELCTYLQVKDDGWVLFGFSSFEELSFFELLLTVSGVGPKTALGVIERDITKARAAIVGNDVSFFTSVPRLGTKNAQKIIIELRPKLTSANADVSVLELDAHKDLISALLGMGFSRNEIMIALKQLPKETTDITAQLKWMLKKLHTKT